MNPILPRGRPAPDLPAGRFTATESRGFERAALAGFGLIFVAALLLWWRYGPSVFVDGLAAAWRCF
jgi:hypothetical protein